MNANLTDRLGLLHSLISYWLLHLSDLESAFTVLRLVFWALISIVTFLVATIAFHILHIDNLDQFSGFFEIDGSDPPEALVSTVFLATP
jgi:hypothetical protein